eukprot:TRINITY_DN20126_c0_g1_i1.p1 TRINITY_DN20126_c0_g1~~TRINITY_DN20126_c0_g1_i1.p1  ORF type:complete len:254 (-),score=38.74 TRINITY_DN20126_c0_g1_i1:733-1413(-)
MAPPGMSRQPSLENFQTYSKRISISRSSSGGLNVFESSICRSESPHVPSQIGIWAAQEATIEERSHFDITSASNMNSFKFSDGSGLQSSLPGCAELHVGSTSPVESALSKAFASRRPVPVILNVVPSPNESTTSSSVLEEQRALAPARATSDSEVEVTAEVTPAEQQQPSITSNVESLSASSSVFNFLVGIVSRISCHPMLSSAAMKVTQPSRRVDTLKAAALIRL